MTLDRLSRWRRIDDEPPRIDDAALIRFRIRTLGNITKAAA